MIAAQSFYYYLAVLFILSIDFTRIMQANTSSHSSGELNSKSNKDGYGE